MPTAIGQPVMILPTTGANDFMGWSLPTAVGQSVVVISATPGSAPASIPTTHASAPIDWRGCTKVARHFASFAVGGGIVAGTTYALVRHVQRGIAHANVNANAAVWIKKASELYDACYNGCNDCSDPSFAYTACARTAGVVSGINCDGNAMWNWAERYPQVCLEFFGEGLRQKALAEVRQDARDQLALIILTVAAGAVGYVVAYKVIGCLGSRWGAARTTDSEV
jgi:hypothetical protein